MKKPRHKEKSDFLKVTELIYSKVSKIGAEESRDKFPWKAMQETGTGPHFRIIVDKTKHKVPCPRATQPYICHQLLRQHSTKVLPCIRASCTRQWLTKPIRFSSWRTDREKKQEHSLSLGAETETQRQTRKC